MLVSSVENLSPVVYRLERNPWTPFSSRELQKGRDRSKLYYSYLLVTLSIKVIFPEQ